MIELKKHHHEVRERVRAFSEKFIRPVATEFDAKQEFPEENMGRMAEEGLLGMQVPKEYGGTYTDTLSYAIAVEEVARVCGSHALIMAAHNSLGAYPIYAFGTERHREKYVHDLATGKYLGAFGLTEPNAGSDSSGTETTAIRQGDEYILNGSKIYTTNAKYAGTVIVTAKTSKEAKAKGITAFIVDRNFPGFEVGKKENKLGMRASDTSMLHFNDCRVPAENMMGEENKGFVLFMKTLDGGRVSIGALAIGLGQAAYEQALAYAKIHSDENGELLIDQQWVQFMLADMEVQLMAARHLVYDSALLKDSGVRYTRESAAGKLYASEVAMKVCYNAMTIQGYDALRAEHPTNRAYRDAKLCEIGEGTSEIQRLVISRMILK